MKITRKETIYQLTFLPRLFPVNCYFVNENDGLTLIDAALPYSSKAIIKASEAIGKPIVRIILTHAHEDHVGALDNLKKQFPHIPVYISERDSRLMLGDRSLNEDEPNTPIRGSVPKKLQTRADIFLKDGDKIGSLLALSTPGHTPGSMSFLDTRNHSCVVGDLFQTRGGIAVSGHVKPLFPFPAMATWNKSITLDSAYKIRDLKPSLLATGHGKMLEHPNKKIDDAIASCKKSLGFT